MEFQKAARLWDRVFSAHAYTRAGTVLWDHQTKEKLDHNGCFHQHSRLKSIIGLKSIIDLSLITSNACFSNLISGPLLQDVGDYES